MMPEDSRQTSFEMGDLSASQLLLMLKQLPIKFYIKDEHQRIVYMNDEALRFHEFSSLSEAVGQTDRELFDASHYKQTEDDEASIVATGNSLIDFEELESRDGGQTRVLTSKLPLHDTASREIIGIFGISKDITHVFRNQEYLQVLFDVLPQCIFVKDIHLKITWCNRSFSDWHRRFLHVDDVIGMTDFDLWKERPELAEGFQNADRRVNKSGATMGPIEEKHIFPSGEKRILNTTKLPLVNAKGEIDGIVGVFFDVTEQRQIDKTAEGIARNIGHGLKTWMTTLQMNLDRHLKKNGGSPELIRIQSGFQVLRQLALNTSALAALEHSTSKSLNIAVIIREQIAQTGDERISTREELPDVVAGIYEIQFRFAIAELLNNALRHAPGVKDSGRIEVWWSVADGLEIHVSDNGSGISMEMHEDGIFMPGTTSDGMRTGLGLSTVKRVAELHGGHVNEIGQHGLGAHFVFKFPSSRIRDVIPRTSTSKNTHPG